MTKQKWSLEEILSSLHEDVEKRLATARKALQHPGDKGHASEKVWLKLFRNYLPKRYKAKSAHIVDSKGEFSDQIDVVIFDRQYSPLIFEFGGKLILPAESVYAVFECKQTINAENIRYARRKIKTVRRLYRTSSNIPHAGGIHDKKEPVYIWGGILTFDSDWDSVPENIEKHLRFDGQDDKLDLGCVASRGYFSSEKESKDYDFCEGDKAVTAFLFHFISMLQTSGTVAMIDVKEYAKWLTSSDS